MKTIPFEAQMNVDGQRTCGAAALNMIYKSMGLDLPQTAIWRVISLPDAHGTRYARTYRMAFDAMLRNVHAVAFRANDPIRAVRETLHSGCDVIMNHRLQNDTGYGHYTVALAADDEFIHFHDPQFGPAQKRTGENMRELWRVRHNDCEITGDILIALARNATSHACTTCGSQLPENIPCSQCLGTFSLQPAVGLGCVKNSCDGKLWQSILCPYCDVLLAADSYSTQPNSSLDVGRDSVFLSKRD